MSYLLIVDDDDDFANAAAKVLQDAGHEVAVELDTENALKSMQQRQPDLLVLDVMFPESTSAGFELARKIRHHEDSLKDIPVLMLTAVNATFPLGFGSGDIDDNWLPIADFLEKPVDFNVLRNKVSELLERGASAPDSEKEESES